jgi:lipid kinase YegS
MKPTVELVHMFCRFLREKSKTDDLDQIRWLLDPEQAPGNGEQMSIRLIINGKKAGLEPVRAAVFEARQKGGIEVRSTWEGGDVERMVREAVGEGCRRLVVGGGDGTVKEMADALMKVAPEDRPEMSILPLGTANDFATACGIPWDPAAALSLAQSGSAVAVDCVRANDEYFINVASGGFGAQVTATTPTALKNFLGGGAYTLSGLVQALNFTPHTGTARMPDLVEDADMIVGAVCNGRQAGGGQQLAPGAYINDGLLDVVVLHSFPAESAMQVVREIREPGSQGQYAKRYQVPWIELDSNQVVPINLDGEPANSKKTRFEVQPGAIQLVLPADCPVLAPG